MSSILNHSKHKTYGTSSEVMQKACLSTTSYFLHSVEMTDTLINLAIKYNVTIQSIRQLNMIWCDSDLYALREIRIPNSTTEVFIASSENTLQTNPPKVIADSSLSEHTPKIVISCKRKTTKASSARDQIDTDKDTKCNFDNDFFDL